MAQANSRKKGIEFGLAIPQMRVERSVDMRLVREFVERSEERGFGSLWAADTVLSAQPCLESVGLLAYVAAISERPKLGVAVIVSPLRNPVQLAKGLSDLDVMSNGRLIVGLGLGSGGPRPGVESSNEHLAFGLGESARVARFNEGLRVMKALWTEEKARMTGRFVRLEGVDIAPKPLQKPHPPVWFGGGHPNVLRRAAKWADGWIGGGGSSESDFRSQANALREALDREGRDPDTFPIAKRLYLHIDDDEEEARRRARKFMAAYYGDPDIANGFGALGSISRIRAAIEDVLDAGADTILLHPIDPKVEDVDALAEVVDDLVSRAQS